MQMRTKEAARLLLIMCSSRSPLDRWLSHERKKTAFCIFGVSLKSSRHLLRRVHISIMAFSVTINLVQKQQSTESCDGFIFWLSCTEASISLVLAVPVPLFPHWHQCAKTNTTERGNYTTCFLWMQYLVSTATFPLQL